MTNHREPFLKMLAGAQRTAKTIETYDLGVRRFEQFLAENQADLNSLGQWPLLLQDYITHLTNDGLEPRSIRTYLAAVRQYLTYLRTIGLQIPTLDVLKQPKIPEDIKLVLRQKTLATYCEVSRRVREPYSTALRLLPLSGLRVTECCELDVEDLLFQGEHWVSLHVKRAKGHKARIVPCLPVARTLLENYLEVRAQMPVPDRQRVVLFPDKHGYPIKARNVRRHMQKVRVELGLTRLTPHVLRHTFNTLMDEYGVDPSSRSKILGHTTNNMNDHYTHPSNELLSSRLEAVDTSWFTGDDE